MENFDISQFIEPFIETAKERLLTLEQGFLRLEKGEINETLLEDLMREAHTLKGEARMLDFTEISEKAHYLEDILLQLRDSKGQDISSVMDQLFAGLEELKQLISGIKKEKKGGEEETEGEKGEIIEKSSETIRVKSDILDKLANLSLETIVNFKQIERTNCQLRLLVQNIFSVKRKWENLKKTVRVLGIIPEENRDFVQFQDLFYGCLNHLHRIWSQYQNILTTQASISEEILMQSLSSRMVPLATIFDLYPGQMRSIAKELGKKLDFKVEGREIEIDKSIIEAINEPMVHLLRNAIDHGIEPPVVRESKGKPPVGKITLRAFQREGKVIIEIEDDGEGINLDKIKKKAMEQGIILSEDIQEIAGEVPSYITDVITHSGFSTKEKVTKISGRGVGLDAVKHTVENLNGSFRIFSYPNKGTKFVLELPLTIAMLPVLIVRASTQFFAIPLQWVDRVLNVDSQKIKQLKGKEQIKIDGQLLSILNLNKILGFPSFALEEKDLNASKKGYIVVLKYQELYPFIVEDLFEQREIIVRPKPSYLKTPLVVGASILEDGSVAFILNVSELIKSAPDYAVSVSIPSDKGHKGFKKLRVLVVDDALITRTLLKNVLLSMGYEVKTAVNGLDALNKLAEEKFDVVVTDVEMPRMDGFQLTRQIKKHPTFKDIPVIIISSHEAEEEKRQGLEAGADAYLPKSTFSQKLLIETIENLIG